MCAILIHHTHTHLSHMTIRNVKSKLTQIKTTNRSKKCFNLDVFESLFQSISWFGSDDTFSCNQTKLIQTIQIIMLLYIIKKIYLIKLH